MLGDVLYYNINFEVNTTAATTQQQQQQLMYQTNAALTVPFFTKKVYNYLFLKNNNKTGSNAEQSIFSRSLLLSLLK